jgi:hypothetical protein
MQTENYYISQIKPDRVPRKYSYMNRARKYNRKAWLAEKRSWVNQIEDTIYRLDQLRAKYDQMAGFNFMWT